MKMRMISSLLGLPIVIISLVVGGEVLVGVLYIASMIGLFEFYKAYKIDSIGLKVIGYMASFVYYFLIVYDKQVYLQEFMTVLIIVLLIAYLFVYPKYNLKDIMIILIGFFYVVYLMSYILLIRNQISIGVYMLWLVFIIAFGSDTFAFTTGKLIGKHKLAPKISPNKTIEGSIGGIIGAILLSFIYGLILINYKSVIDPKLLPLFIVIGGIGAMLSQIGDLVASAIKRQTNIKDFSKIMPGHGGILDRLDSVIFTAPFVYYIIKFFFT